MILQSGETKETHIWEKNTVLNYTEKFTYSSGCWKTIEECAARAMKPVCGVEIEGDEEV